MNSIDELLFLPLQGLLVVKTRLEVNFNFFLYLGRLLTGGIRT